MAYWIRLIWAKRLFAVMLVMMFVWAGIAIGNIVDNHPVLAILNFLCSAAYCWLVVKNWRRLDNIKGRVWLSFRTNEQFISIIDYCEKHRIHYECRGNQFGFIDDETKVQVQLST